MELEKVGRKELSIRRCTRESCPCGNKFTSLDYIGFVNSSHNFAFRCIDSMECRASNSYFFFNLPGNLKSSEILSQSLKLQRGTKVMDDLGDFIIEYSTASNSGNIILTSTWRWILDSIEGTLIARTLLKSSLLFQSAPRDNNLIHVRSRSINTRQIKSSELAIYPFDLYDTASRKPRWDMIPFPGEMILSCSSSNSSGSHRSNPFNHRSFSKGMLHRVWKGDISSFEFSLEDDPNEVYIANPHKIHSSIYRASDYIYLFHSRTDANNALVFVGKMKVTSSIVFSSSRSRSIETEFVLVGAHGDHSSEMQGSTSAPSKSKGLSKKVSEIFRSSHALKHKSTHKIDIESDAINHLADDFPPSLELAAIVVKDHRQISKEEVGGGGGWGLKFLQKAEVDHADTSSPEPSVVSKVCKESCAEDRGESGRDIHVLVPAGFHGGPATRIGGPSSLTKRWRSGGHCDCGGWDIGCPLSVLCNTSATSPHFESQEEDRSVNLFNQGAGHGESILKLVNMNESLYYIYFHSNLSALQAFSIGVSIIHTQTPDLYPKL